MKPLPVIGLDRYVSRHWLDAALAVAAGESDRSAVVALLANEITSVDARSKAMTILNRIWLRPHPALADFASAGIAICQARRDADTLPLHWGMALASHPFFATAALAIGKLLRVHGEFTAAQINRRLKEQLGDRVAIRRATGAVLQSLLEWGVICAAEDRKRTFIAAKPVAVKSPAASMWLLEACVRASGRSLILSEHSNLLFPIRMEVVRETDFSRQSRLRLMVSGSGTTTVSIAGC